MRLIFRHPAGGQARDGARNQCRRGAHRAVARTLSKERSAGPDPAHSRASAVVKDVCDAAIGEAAAALKAAVGEAAGRRRLLLSEIDRHVARLERQEFQLAVLGQFKRGKSPLVNALVGRRVLASGELLLTASPTLLRGGSGSSLTVTEEDGRIRHSASRIRAAWPSWSGRRRPARRRPVPGASRLPCRRRACSTPWC